MQAATVAPTSANLTMGRSLVAVSKARMWPTLWSAFRPFQASPPMRTKPPPPAAACVTLRIFAVFSGNDGSHSTSAQWCARNVVGEFEQALAQRREKARGLGISPWCSVSVSADSGEDCGWSTRHGLEHASKYITGALEDACVSLDARLCHDPANMAACCGLIVVISPKKIFCANVGTSRAILQRGRSTNVLGPDSVVALSHDFSVGALRAVDSIDDADETRDRIARERRRIQLGGGEVDFENIYARLAPSPLNPTRTFGGDVALKSTDPLKYAGIVTPGAGNFRSPIVPAGKIGLLLWRAVAVWRGLTDVRAARIIGYQMQEMDLDMEALPLVEHACNDVLDIAPAHGRQVALGEGEVE